jgi:hypothetical protein
MSALNLQGYKFRMFHDQIGDALMEAASLALLLAVTLVLWSTDVWSPVKALVSGASALVWTADFAIRFNLTRCSLRDKKIASKSNHKE